MTGDIPATEALAEREVDDHHRLIEAWLRGDAPRDAFAALAARHAPGFTLHGPDGDAVPLGPLMDGLERAHGTVPGLTIEIRAVRVVEARDDLVAAVYEEHHDAPSGRTARRSTVLLVRDAAAPGGLLWRHLHETWIVPPAV
ncbi:DUF4440 domain-containing protein [Actinomadura roseirufa]|uniref:DUF4440 domain-containing protein n=1 Tax=Actinomadura roseirufa TaxID=2094049 RepID=UPI001041207C|nr:DUF4440 domain-containing protein [Actinomadura roseirufa]